ncbi:MAG: acetate--CoA ligase [Deltaproteobacteria bacterium]|nr:acetate--CoA ligase [Deltaproteobacteria bacterium]MBW2629111.1 acetate--CoA ligase [Deltaproteobacteria bacterium]
MRIEKRPRRSQTAPRMTDYDQERASFSWEVARAELAGLPGGRGLNIAYEAIGRHVADGHGDQTAIIWLGKKGGRVQITYAEVDSLTNQFAQVLAKLGIEAGDRVYSLAGRIPELYVCALGTLKHRAVFCPLFSAFGPEPIAERLNLGEARVLFTTERLYKRRIAAIRERIPTLEHVIVVADPKKPEKPEATVDWAEAMSEASTEYEIGDTDPEAPALLHFTSGTTGTPKGAYHVHQAVLTHYVTGKIALDLHPEDIYWCTADPGWVTGTSYGISAPLTNRVTMVIDEAEFDPKRWYAILEEEKVQVWYTAPTAIRMLMKAGAELPQSKDLSKLRFMASVGEPLNPQAVVWGYEVFGMPFHDNWWQTETGGIMISNYASMDVKPGSMGRPMPGISAGIVREGDDGHLHEVDDPETDGELALRPDWPSVFRGYWNDKERYDACFRDGWYLSGDLARRDEEGYYWFVGRSDDVIKSAGHLIGPFEVESVIMKHPAVAEVGVIGKPDPVAGTIIKAFVSLQPGYEWSDELQKEIIGFGRKNLGTTAPREIDCVESLPKTRSGKIMRRLLKARELGLPEGDTSTLEGGDR